MTFTLFRRTPTPFMQKRTPEIVYFDLIDDRWELRRLNLRTVTPYALYGVVATFLSVFPSVLYLVVIQSKVGLPLAFAVMDLYSIDPFLLMLWLFWFTVAAYTLTLVPFVFLTVWHAPRRRMRVFQDALRIRSIFYCPRFTCRYDCTGITGNICPECGSVVPGLEAVAAG